jgi:hypothetical protein
MSSFLFIYLADASLLVQQHKTLESKIQQSPSRVAKTPRAVVSNLTLAVSSLVALSASMSALTPLTLSHMVFPGSYNSSGLQIFLWIRIQDTVDTAQLYTTLS